MEGFLDMERLASGKRFQGTWIHLDAGEPLLLSYRPVPEYFGFVERRVVFTGERYEPRGQAVGAQHFRIATIELAPGETPYDPVPATLPKPPVLRDRASLRARHGRWVQVVGTLMPGKALPKDGSLETMETSIRLQDGSLVMSRTAKSYYERDWRALEGQVVTSLGKLHIDHGALRLGYASSVCPGEVDGCGMPGLRSTSGKKSVP